MESKDQIPPVISAWLSHIVKMGSRTSDSVVNDLWKFCANGDSALYFVFETRTIWRTSQAAWHDLHLGYLAPDNCDPPGSGPTRLMPDTWSKIGCRISVEPLEVSNVNKAHADILAAIHKAQTLADIFSLAACQPVVLRAARRLESSWSQDHSEPPLTPPAGKTHFLLPLEPQEENTSTVIEDDWVHHGLSSIVELLMGIPDPLVRSTLQAAISWHAQANELRGLGRYLHYWVSIELLGAFFYGYLEPTYIGKPSPSEVENTILRKLLDLDSKNHREIIVECSRLLQPTARQQILALSKIVLPDKPDIREKLFGIARDPSGNPIDGARSMFDIRNDIAHGNVSPMLRQYLDRNIDIFPRFQRLSQQFIFSVLVNAPRLCQHRSPHFTPGD